MFSVRYTDICIIITNNYLIYEYCLPNLNFNQLIQILNLMYFFFNVTL